MPRMPSARELVGRRIVGFESRPFRTRPDSKVDRSFAHDPVIVLDDGSRLTFSAEETDTGEYGVFIIRTMPEKG